MTFASETTATHAEVSLVGDVLRVGKRSILLTDVAGIENFVKREAEFWKWVTEISDYSLNRDLAEYSELVQFANQSLLIGHESDHISQYGINRLIEIYCSGTLLLSGSPRAQFAKSIAAKDPELATYVLRELLGKRGRVDSHNAVEAVVVATLFKHGIRKNVDSERASLQRLREDWDDALKEAKAEHRGLRSNFELEHQTIVSRIATVEDRASEFVALLNQEINRHADLHESREQRFEQEVDLYREQGTESVASIHAEVTAAKEELQRLTAAYNEHMALKAPVAYWQENGDMHHASARAYLKCLAIAAPVLIMLLSVLGWFLLGDAAKPPLGHMILFFMFSGMVVWLLRVLTRLYLSHKHLEIDARERIVAAKTYLALVGDGVEARDAERTIIMGTLFRPAAIGIIQDDAMPASSIELVGRLMKGDK
jgi:hypothetical protein